MLTVRYYRDLVTPAFRGWIRTFVKYDDEGRSSCWITGIPFEKCVEEVGEVVMPGVTFSGVLLQGYRDGSAVTPCHTDAGGTGRGFILSIGASRTFRVHRIDSPCGDSNAVTVECVEGTVLIMDEAFHAGWHHQVIADPGVTGEKLSLVFRTTPRGA